jgi:hypothetical protein
MKRLVLTLAAVAGAAVAMSQPFYVRGEFNGWDTSLEMSLVSGDHYTGTVTGLNPGQGYKFKAANADWSIEAPAFTDVKSVANGSGEIVVHFYSDASHLDGWSPNGRRIGYSDSGHGWEFIGSFDGWSGEAMSLSGGVYNYLAVLPAGNYEFKFRKAGDWGVNIGQGFAQDGANDSFVSDGVNATWARLDLENGRYLVSAVPEPASMLALAGGAALLLRRRRAR